MPLLRCIRGQNIKSGEYFKGTVPDSLKDPRSKASIREWTGNLSEEKGLLGSVKEEDLKRIFNGDLPPEYIMGGQCSTEDDSVNPGYELIFSLNPQLSQVVMGLQKPELADKVFSAHVQAVKMALHEVEEMVTARVRNNDIRFYEATKSMLAALLSHFPNESDPELHVYVLILNVTKRSDGVWAPMSGGLRGFHTLLAKQLDYLEGIYQLELAKKIEAMGFTVRKTGVDGQFVVVDIPMPNGIYFGLGG